MKGTGSNTIVARDVFVPEHRFLPYSSAFQCRYRTEYTDESVYRTAFVPVTILILVGSRLGIAKAALDHVIENARKRGVTHTQFEKRIDSTGFQILVSEAANAMQRLWRDMHVASHHAITEWQVNLEIYGKALLGIEPNITPLI